MGPAQFILAALALWAGVLLFTVAHALTTGRIRMGKMGGPPIERAEEPGRFWSTLAISVVGLLVLFFVLRGVLQGALPAAWSEAMEVLGLARKH